MAKWPRWTTPEVTAQRPLKWSKKQQQKWQQLSNSWHSIWLCHGCILLWNWLATKFRVYPAYCGGGGICVFWWCASSFHIFVLGQKNNFPSTIKATGGLLWLMILFLSSSNWCCVAFAQPFDSERFVSSKTSCETRDSPHAWNWSRVSLLKDLKLLRVVFIQTTKFFRFDWAAARRIVQTREPGAKIILFSCLKTLFTSSF